MTAFSSLSDILSALERHYGAPSPIILTDPFHLILWENVGYLVDDTRRETAFRALEERVGLELEQILAASDDTLVAIAKLGGIFPELRAERLRQCAELLLGGFGGDLRLVLELPLAKAKRALARFPAIGEPGAEKILLFARQRPVLALDSNGLRVLVRLGFAEEEKNYSRMYRTAQEAASAQIPEEIDGRIRAYHLLRGHGQELCKRMGPKCGECPVRLLCPHAARN